MRRRAWECKTLGLCLLAIVLSGCASAPRDVGAIAKTYQLPGRTDRETVLLPNRWRLSPAGNHLPLGDLPLNMALSPEGRYLAVNNNGFGEHFVAIVDTEADRIVSRLSVAKSWYGLCFSPDGATLYVTGADDNWIYVYDFSKGYASNERKIILAEQGEDLYPAGLAISPDGHRLYAVNNLADSVSVIDVVEGEVLESIPLEEGAYPYACVPSTDGKSLYVSLWGRSAVAVIDTEQAEVIGRIPTDDHPNAMVLSPDGKRLFVANANSNTVSVIDVLSRKRIETISTALYPDALEGSTPNAVALSQDGQTLLIANADNNNVAVVDCGRLGASVVRGFIPTGWYPTAVAFPADEKKIYVANGKGTTSYANPQGPSPLMPRTSSTQYIARILQGSLSVIAFPDDPQLDQYTARVYANSPYLKERQVTAKPDGPNPIPAKVGEPSPIKYCVYIIKENRTYDQVFGDMPEGNGDPQICIFPERVTPNHHALARQFVLLDNFYVESEVSADGHNWTMGAYATDYVEKTWPQLYSGRGRSYDYEGGKEIVYPSAGYLWDQCRRAGVPYRSYGEFIQNGETPAQPGTARVEALEGHFDPFFRSYDLGYRDMDRAKRFIEELRGFEQKGALPQFIVMRLPNDHTAGTRTGYPTPLAMVADNDLALGRVVEALSRSRFWNEMAIFVVEDDAQNGSDHVDAHRTVALVISPYTKRRIVDSTFYTTSSMLRTMELILGLEPMSQFDAAATPMYNAFTPEADVSPYVCLPANVDLDARNAETAWGAQRSMEMNLAREDAANDIEFNEIIWKAVRGADSEMPPPVRAAFVRPLLENEQEF